MGIKFRWFRHQLVFDGSPAAKSDHQSLNNPASTSYGVYRSKAVDEDFEEPVQLRNPQPSTSQNASKKQCEITKYPF